MLPALLICLSDMTDRYHTAQHYSSYILNSTAIPHVGSEPSPGHATNNGTNKHMQPQAIIDNTGRRQDAKVVNQLWLCPNRFVLYIKTALNT